MLTMNETAMRPGPQATDNHPDQGDTEDSRKLNWAIPVGIVVLLLILAVTIASIASDIFPTY
jgi:hypothetical protein